MSDKCTMLLQQRVRSERLVTCIRGDVQVNIDIMQKGGEKRDKTDHDRWNHVSRGEEGTKRWAASLISIYSRKIAHGWRLSLEAVAGQAAGVFSRETSATRTFGNATRALRDFYSRRNTRCCCWKEEEMVEAGEQGVECELAQMDMIDPTPCNGYVSATTKRHKLRRGSSYQ